MIGKFIVLTIVAIVVSPSFQLQCRCNDKYACLGGVQTCESALTTCTIYSGKNYNPASCTTVNITNALGVMSGECKDFRGAVFHSNLTRILEPIIQQLTAIVNDPTKPPMERQLAQLIISSYDEEMRNIDTSKDLWFCRCDKDFCNEESLLATKSAAHSALLSSKRVGLGLSTALIVTIYLSLPI